MEAEGTMIQTLIGVAVLLVGGYFLFLGVRRSTHEGADQQKGFLGRFGTLMVGILILLVGVALVVPAQNSEPVPDSETPNSSLELTTPFT